MQAYFQRGTVKAFLRRDQTQWPRLLLALFAFTASAFSHDTKTNEIDALCSSIRAEFVEALPQYFAGPDPWVQLDQQPLSFQDAAVFSVYYEGAKPMWVVLELQAPGNTWFETTHYFFDGNGLIQKRERYLDQFSTHIQIREDKYFKGQKIFKTRYRHSVLGRESPGGRNEEDWASFYDPNAPFYTSTSDLPALIIESGHKLLANFDLSTLDRLISLLKFSRLGYFQRAETQNRTAMVSGQAYRVMGSGWHRS